MWHYERAIGKCSNQNIARLTYPSTSICNGLEVEIANSNCGMMMYLNISSLHFAPMQENPEKTIVCISIEGNEEEIIANRLRGGQRLLIPQEAREKIINTLLACKDVTLKVGRYKETISHKDFHRPFTLLANLRTS